MEVFLYLVLEFFFFTFCKQGFPLPLNVISQIISSYIFLQGVPKKHSYKIFCTAALMGWNKIWKIWKHAWVVAQDLVGRGVRAERPAHRDDRMLHCSHPMRAAAENFIRVFFLGHLVEKTIMKYSHPQLVYYFFTFQWIICMDIPWIDWPR